MALIPLRPVRWDASSVIVCLIVLCVGGYQAISYIRERRRGRGAGSWPSVEGTVESAAVGISLNGSRAEESVRSIGSVEVDSHLLGDGLVVDLRHTTITWYVHVAYSFTVDGEYYSGYADRSVSSKLAGEEYARGLQGKKFPVRYQPGNPDKSAVLDDEWIAAIPSSGTEGECAQSFW